MAQMLLHGTLHATIFEAASLPKAGGPKLFHKLFDLDSCKRAHEKRGENKSKAEETTSARTLWKSLGPPALGSEAASKMVACSVPWSSICAMAPSSSALLLA
ncbi:hypothetical protein GUJ93_ZPchr0831g7172 [Zizania palustris]|uniref:Uncharacterized protein n=1 Tax=Zizania palustris TaxID=103762 RepID=A0A8J5RES4_ZIZPA|nr:hypothetical protein GUJ93_ZPchr0831g7172 [Zizania palustris]